MSEVVQIVHKLCKSHYTNTLLTAHDKLQMTNDRRISRTKESNPEPSARKHMDLGWPSSVYETSQLHLKRPSGFA